MINGVPGDYRNSADRKIKIATKTAGGELLFYCQRNQIGTCFRDEVPNTTPSGTTSPDLFEPVKVTSNNNPFTVEDPVQYVAPPLENLTYDADGNLLTDGRWTYTWDGADRLIRMESLPFQQPAYENILPPI